MLFSGALDNRQALSIAETLIEAGADLDFQVDGKGDTRLIGAASLAAEDVGLATPNRKVPGRNVDMKYAPAKYRRNYLSMRRAIIMAVVPLKKTNPRTLIESPLLTAVRP